MEDNLQNSTSPEVSAPDADSNQGMVSESELARSPSDKTVGNPSTATFYRPPRLGIIHLLCWIALTAVLLSIYKSVIYLIDQKSMSAAAVTLSQQLSLAIGVIQIIFVSACWVGLFLIARDKRRGIPGRLQPGHWIVLADCCHKTIGIFLFVLLQAIIAAGIMSSDGKLSTTILFYAVPQALVYLLAAGLYITGSVRCPAGFLWRSLLGLRALGALFAVAVTTGLLVFYFNQQAHWPSSLTTIMSYAGIISMILCSGLPIVILLIAVVRDLYLRNRRDWLHWLGVAILSTTVLQPLSHLIRYLAMRGVQ